MSGEERKAIKRERKGSTKEGREEVGTGRIGVGDRRGKINRRLWDGRGEGKGKGWGVEWKGSGKVEQGKGKWIKEGSDDFKWPARAR